MTPRNTSLERALFDHVTGLAELEHGVNAAAFIARVLDRLQRGDEIHGATYLMRDNARVAIEMAEDLAVYCALELGRLDVYDATGEAADALARAGAHAAAADHQLQRARRAAGRRRAT